MLDHLSRQHPEKADKDVSYFHALRDKRTKQPRISMLIAKTGHSNTIGEELLIPKIPLSNNTVQRRMDEMANNVEDALCRSLRTTQFSIQIDESCLPGNEALLLTYVRFIKDKKLVQELLFAMELKRIFRLRI
uniref:DUF4371 domain-containing protein n=1 Tax=Trichuris muris TaxID=70415 RepID=A0A5S6QTJ3_TRIMR